MKEHYVTLFNSKFLPQGISLLLSMEKHIENFNLWILCLDIECYNLLCKLNNKAVTPLLLSDFETSDLLKVKKIRSFTEYCWTLTPFTFKFVHSIDNTIKRLTYLDADMFFFKNPSDIFYDFEKSQKSVLITKHNYSPFYDHSNTSGKYCVQFLTINYEDGELIRKDWEYKCLEWCYNRFEDGKFGDQKYLDRWPIDFKNKVHVLVKNDIILAPWNITKYSTEELIIFHFHGLRVLNNDKFYLGNYLIPRATYDQIYKIYLGSLKESIDLLKSLKFYDYVQQNNSLLLKIKSILSVPYFILKLFKYRHIIKI